MFFVQSEGSGGSPAARAPQAGTRQGTGSGRRHLEVARLPVPLWGSSKRQKRYEMKKIPENRKIFLHSLSLQILPAICA